MKINFDNFSQSARMMIIVLMMFFCNGCTKEITEAGVNTPIIEGGPIEDGDYYVATWGNDLDPGTFEKPWATWQKAFETAKAGDVVYFRGGVYYPSKTAYGNNITQIYPSIGIGHNGLPGNPICFYNYPGETPVLDCKNVHATGNFITGIMMYDVHWINWRGLTIRNVYQRKQDVEPKGISGMPISNMTFERMTVHNIGGCGWYMHSSVNVTPPAGYPDLRFGWDDNGIGLIPYDTTRYINCDTYQCCDTLRVNSGNHPGNMADGFKTIGYAGAYISYQGCRAWHCSDDGFDLPGPYRKIVRNCWSFAHLYDGFGEDFEGNGFKIGAVSDSIPFPTLMMTNCIAAFTSAGLFDLEYSGYYRSNARVFNNTFYKNKIGIQISDNSQRPRSLSIFRNNIIYGSTSHDAIGRPLELSVGCYYTESNNTWEYSEEGSIPRWKYAPEVNVTDEDFISLNPKDLNSPRNEDGSLPEVNFLKLAKGSDLIDAGIEVGLPNVYNNRPDIGAFESQY